MGGQLNIARFVNLLSFLAGVASLYTLELLHFSPASPGLRLFGVPCRGSTSGSIAFARSVVSEGAGGAPGDNPVGSDR